MSHATRNGVSQSKLMCNASSGGNYECVCNLGFMLKEDVIVRFEAVSHTKQSFGLCSLGVFVFFRSTVVVPVLY